MALGAAKSSIQVIERMMSLLDALTQHSDPVNLKQLAAQTSLHPSTAHRILAVMVQSRLVDRIEPGTYRLGIRLLELGSMVKSRISVREEALAHMQKLHQNLRETVNLALRQDDEVVYIERTAAGRSMPLPAQITGTRAPLHITALGKIFLAHDGIASTHDYARRTGLRRFTENTVVDLDTLAGELEAIRARGYAVDNEEAQVGVSCIAAAIYDDAGALVASLSVSAPSDRLSHDWVDQVRKTARDISKSIGFGAECRQLREPRR